LRGGGIIPDLAQPKQPDAQQKPQEKYKPKYLRDNDTTFRAFASYLSETGFIRFNKDKEPLDPNLFFDKFGANIGLGKHYQMRLIRDNTDEQGMRHRRYQLYYKNIRVEDTDYSLHSVGKRLLVADGSMVDALDIDVSKPMSENRAMSYALANQKLDERLFRGQDKLPKGELVLANVGGEVVGSSYQFCYIFNIRKEDIELPKGASSTPVRLYVHAESGAVVRSIPLVHNCFDAAHSGHDGNAPSNSKQAPPALHMGQLKAPQTASTFTPLWGGRYGSSRSFETEVFGSGYRLAHQNGKLVTKRASTEFDFLDFDPIPNVEAV
jgi:hypothetical protein